MTPEPPMFFLEYDFIRCEVERILTIRARVLRPHFKPGILAHFEGDSDPDTFHMGAFAPSDKAIACLSMMRRDTPEGRQGYQLRGMAVDPAHQSQGVGQQLLSATWDELGLRGPHVVWCNARESALRFYEKAGFVVHGGRFQIEGIGPHFVMMRVAGATQ